MTLKRIDEVLAGWNQRLESMAANLLWLQADSTYRTLSGADGGVRVPLTGLTAARVQPALSGLPSVFQNFDLLNSTIGRAVEARRNFKPLFGGEQKLAEMEHLLFGKSIQLPVVDLPLGERTLLGQAQVQAGLTPEELLASMPGAFAAARDAVLAVDRAWQELAERLAIAEQKAESLYREQQGCGLPADSALNGVMQALQQVRGQVQSDPLGALEQLKTKVQPALEQAGRNLAEIVAARRELERARLRVDELTALHQEATDAASAARARIADCDSLPQPFDAGRIRTLGEWLERIGRSSAGSGPHADCATELRHWTASADDLVAQAKACAEACRAAVALRRELRGRLDALKAKARARGVAESAAVATLASNAELLLAARPTHLAQATGAVAAYASRLNETPQQHELRSERP